MEKRHYSDKRQIIDYSQVIAHLNENTIVCVDLGVLRIIRKLLAERGLWRSTYAKAYYDIDYEIPTKAEFDVVETAIAEFLNETGGDMSICEDLVTALSNLGSGGSGGGSCGCGSRFPSSTPGQGGGATDQTDVEGETVGLTPPSTWGGTEEEYADYKCNAAEYIFEVIKAFFTAMADINTFVGAGATGLTFGALLLSVFETWVVAWAVGTGYIGAGAAATIGAGAIIGAAPAWVAAAIVAAIAAVVVIAGVGIFAIYSTFATDWEAKRDTVICGLYTSTSVSEAKSLLVDELSDTALNFAITGGNAPYDAILRTLTETIISLVITSGFVNQLFAQSNWVDNFTGVYDCSGCGCSGDWTLVRGSLTSGSLLQGTSAFTIQAEFVEHPDDDYYQVSYKSPPSVCCWQYQYSQSAFTYPSWVNDNKWYYDCYGNKITTDYNDTYVLSETICTKGEQAFHVFRSSTPFTLTVTDLQVIDQEEC